MLRDESVTSILFRGLPASVTLGVLSIGLTVLLGTPLGIFMARRQGSWLDNDTALAMMAQFYTAGLLGFYSRTTRSPVLEALRVSSQANVIGWETQCGAPDYIDTALSRNGISGRLAELFGAAPPSPAGWSAGKRRPAVPVRSHDTGAWIP